jgi:CheY-specific phosphatase CheX
MKPASSPPDLSRIGGRALREVFETLLSFSVTEVSEVPPAGDESEDYRLVGIVTLNGDRLSGNVRLQLPEDFARLAVSRVVRDHGGEGPADLGIEDLVGELCNMIAGRVAASLRPEGYAALLDPPVVLRAAHLLPEPGPAREWGRTCWSCEGHVLTLEIQCRYPGP